MSSHPEDKRNAERRYYRTSAVCHRGSDGLGELVTGQLMNVSLTGAQLLVRGEFADNEPFVLALVTPRRETIAEALCTVRWKASEGPGAMRLGVSFAVPLPETVLSQIL